MLIEVVRMVWRRRLLAALAVLVALAAGVGTFLVIKPMQESKAQVLLIGSIKQPGVNGPTNPFSNLGGSLSVVAQVLQVQVNNETTASRLYAKGDTAVYTVEPNLAENAGPTLLITADDKSKAVAQSTMKAVVDEIQSQLSELQTQRGIQSDLFISSVMLTESPHPLPVRKAQVQRSIIVMIASLVVLVGAILLVERRRVRRSRPVVSDEDDATDEVTDSGQPIGPPKTSVSSLRTDDPDRGNLDSAGDRPPSSPRRSGMSRRPDKRTGGRGAEAAPRTRTAPVSVGNRRQSSATITDR